MYLENNWYKNSFCKRCNKGKLLYKQNKKTKSWFIGCSRYPECQATLTLGHLSKSFEFVRNFSTLIDGSIYNGDYTFEDHEQISNNEQHLLRMIYEIGSLEGNYLNNKVDNFFIKLRKIHECSFIVIAKILNKQIGINIKVEFDTSAQKKTFSKKVVNSLKQHYVKSNRDSLLIEELFINFIKYSYEISDLGNEGSHIDTKDAWFDRKLKDSKKLDSIRKLHKYLTIIYNILIDENKKIPFIEKDYIKKEKAEFMLDEKELYDDEINTDTVSNNDLWADLNTDWDD